MFGSQGRKLRRVVILILRPNWIYIYIVSMNFFSVSLILYVLSNIQLNKLFFFFCSSFQFLTVLSSFLTIFTPKSSLDAPIKIESES